MDLINYEIWTAYQKADLKVKAEKTSSSSEKNRLYLHFLSYFTVEVKFSSDKTYLLMDCLAETGQLSKQCSSRNCLQGVNIFSTFKIKIELSPKLQMSKHFHKIWQMRSLT